MTRYGIPDNPTMLEHVVDLIGSSKSAVNANSAIASEVRHFVERFALHNIDFQCEMVRHYIEPELPADALLHRSIRIRNIGNFSWSSQAANPVLLSYHWLDPDGREVHFEGLRTAFPIEIAPGREITIPLRIETPKGFGPHNLEVQLVHENVRWAIESAMLIPVNLTSKAEVKHNIIPAAELPRFTEGEDSRRARGMIHEQLLQGRRDSPLTLLEVGGGSSPECLEIMQERQELNLKLLNIDVSEALLRLLSLTIEHNRPEFLERTAFLCADAMTVNFTERLADAVVICRALHHFPDPVGLLRHVSTWLAPDGFIATVCEPVGNAYDDAGIAALAAGVNEQVFSIDEYRRMFVEAGLRVTGYQVDWGFSLKAILQPA